MNSKPPMGLSDLANMSSGSAPMQQAPAQQAPQAPQQNWGQPQQNWGQQQPMQQGGFNQAPAPMQQPQQQQSWNQPQQAAPAPMQQNFNSAPAPTPAPMASQRPAGGGVVLKKGQKTSLSKMNPNLDNIEVGLGWDIKNQACDLDASAFMLGANGKVVGDDWFVFYGQPSSPDGSIVHRGDSKDGAGYGDDETISIRLSQMNPAVQKVVFVVTINEALTLGLNFSMVANAYVRIVDKSTNKELCKFNLTDYYSNVTSMVVGEIYKHNGEFKLNPVGDGVARDLAGLCEMYGVNVAG